jgi:hypothetical protein
MKQIKIIHTILAYIAIIFDINYSIAQIITDNSPLSRSNVQTILGKNISISNITFNGDISARGTFNGIKSNVGLKRGIILSTGAISNATGPNDDPFHGSCLPDSILKSRDFGRPGDADLDNMVGCISTYLNQCTRDASVLEFDFIPQSSSFSLRYVFASEEYPCYVCSPFNDIFAIFISGPYPSGGLYDKKNIALIPGTETYVGINSVNDGKPGYDPVSHTYFPDLNCISLNNSKYFINNGDVSTPKKDSTVQYNGFTIPLDATAEVVPNQKYHLKIAIADLKDGKYDSAILIQADTNSCSLDITSDKTNLVCGDSTQLKSNVIYYGKDKLNYKWYPSFGLSSDTIPNPITKLKASTIYQVTVTSQNGCFDTDSIKINIKPFSKIKANNYDLECGDSSQLSVTSLGPLINKYKWSPLTGLNSDTIPNPIAKPKTTTTYHVSITSTYGCFETDTIEIMLDFFVYIDAYKTSLECGNSTQLLTTTFYSGTGNLIYKWSPSTGLNSDTILSPIAKPKETTTYTVSVSNSDGCYATDNIVITLNPYSYNPEICIVTVNDSIWKNQVVWNKPISKSISKYNIYCEGKQSNTYDLIGSVPFNKLSTFIDKVSDPFKQSYLYKLSSVDICNFESSLSQYHQTIHLTISQGMGNSWNLQWNDYIGFSFLSYYIYRGTNPKNLLPLDTILSSLNSYTDLNPPSGYVYYLIKVINPNPCKPTKSNEYNSSMSNIATNNPNWNSVSNYTSPENLINIFPNPASGYVEIDFPASVMKNKTMLNIYCIEGSFIRSLPIRSAQTRLDISDLTNGVYVFMFQNNDSVNVKRFIKN